MNHLTASAYLLSAVLAILGSVFAGGRWAHKQIVQSVKEQLKPIDDAVNHRKPGEPRLVELADLIWAETQRQGIEIDALNIRLTEHLGWHKGIESAK